MSATAEYLVMKTERDSHSMSVQSGTNALRKYKSTIIHAELLKLLHCMMFPDDSYFCVHLVHLISSP